MDTARNFMATEEFISQLSKRAANIWNLNLVITSDAETFKQLYNSMKRQRTYLGETMLHFAALNRDHGREMVKYLVNTLEMNMDCKNHLGEEPIQYAVRARNFLTAEEMLRLRNSSTKNLLFFFLGRSELDFANAVLEFNNNLVEEEENGLSAFHYAAREANNKEVCKWLIEKRLDPCKISNTTIPVTPMVVAVYNGNFEFAEELLAHGVGLPKYIPHNFVQNLLCVNRLREAQFMHNLDTSLIFRVFGIGYNSLHLAARHGDLEACRWVIGKGVFPNALTSLWNNTPVHCSAVNKNHGKQLVRYFVTTWGLDVDKRTRLGETALQFALQEENLEAAEELLALGADLKMRNVNLEFVNYLHFCVAKGLVSSAAFLHSRDDSLIHERTYDGLTTMELAKKMGNHEDFINIL